MKTLIISTSEGKIVFSQVDFDVQESNFKTLVTEIPIGKRPIGVNPENNEIILEDIPPSEIDVLKQRTEDLELILTDLLLGGM